VLLLLSPKKEIMKTITLVLIACFLQQSIKVNAQTERSFKVKDAPVLSLDGSYGISGNAVNLAIPAQSNISKTAWHAGATLYFNSKRRNFISFSANYVAAGLKIETKNISSPLVSNSIDLNYLQVPLHLNYQFGNNGFLFAGAGPYASLLLSSAQQQNDILLSSLKKQDYGISAVAGVRLSSRLRFLIKGQWGMADIDNSERTNLGRNRVYSAGLSFSAVNKSGKPSLKKQSPPLVAEIDEASLLFSVEEIMPLNNQGEVVYLTIAPENKNNKLSSLLSVRITIKNKSKEAKTLERVEFECTGNGVNISKSFQPDSKGNVVINADKKFTFQNNRKYHELGDVIKINNPFPSQLKVKFFFSELNQPYVVTRTLSRYQNFTKGGAYALPVKNKDLLMDEYWQTDASHGGGGQVFAYDMSVKGWDPEKGTWTELRQGKNEDKNENFRTYGKGVYAAGDGEVLEVINSWGEAPSTSDTGTAGGNRIKINNGAETVCYYHMQKGSINKDFLKIGARVNKGDFIGLAGNSGSSSGPHIHVHVIWDPDKDGQGPFIPMQFSNIYAIDETLLSNPDANATALWSKLDKAGAPYINDDSKFRFACFWNSDKKPMRYINGLNEVTRFSIAEENYQTEINKIWESGYYPKWVDAFTYNGKIYFNVICQAKSDDVKVEVRHNITAEQYSAEYNKWVNQKNYRLQQIESYKDGNQLKFAVIFIQKPNNPVQQPAYVAASAGQHQKFLDDYIKQGFAPVNISVVSIGNNLFYTAFYEKRNVNVYARTTLTQDEYQEKFNELIKDNWEQVYINAYRDDGNTKFSVIWYKKQNATPLAAVRRASLNEIRETWSDNLNAGGLTQCITAYEENNKIWFAGMWKQE
jgi:murein DD-endopeptidase MepM/ murein hydrolase activator NlpD